MRSDEAVRQFLNGLDTPIAAHLTCAGMTKEHTNRLVAGWEAAGVSKIVALRGDNKSGEQAFSPHPGGYKDTIDLINGIRDIFSGEIIVSGYPEVHPDSSGIEEDLELLRQKIDAGATKAVTQFFFDPEVFLRYRDAIADKGLSISVIPGIMPIWDYKKVTSFAHKSGTSIPEWVLTEMESVADKPRIPKMVATSLCVDLVGQLAKEGVDFFHFYTMNKLDLNYAVCSRLKSFNLK